MFGLLLDLSNQQRGVQMFPHMSIQTFKQTSKLLIQFAHVQSCVCTEAADCSCPFSSSKTTTFGSWKRRRALGEEAQRSRAACFISSDDDDDDDDAGDPLGAS